MLARTHDLAAVSALGIAYLARPETTITISTVLVALLANQIGGIAPDIDQPTAPLWRNLPVGRHFGRLFSILTSGHRALTHSLLGMVIMGALARSLLEFLHPIMPSVDIGLVWWAFMIGFVSHLVMDSLTREGVPWLLPIPIKFGFPPIKMLRMTTGKKMEKYVVLPLLVMINIWIYSNYSGQLVELLQNRVVQ
jgi:inner membrane protein